MTAYNGDKTERRRISFYGLVQGVGFRWQAQRAADIAGVTGWVRNEYDGSVTMEIQGIPRKLDEVVSALERGRFIHIDRISSRAIALDPNERTFRVRY